MFYYYYYYYYYCSLKTEWDCSLKTLEPVSAFKFVCMYACMHVCMVYVCIVCGSRGGLMVSALGSGSGGPGSSLGQGAALCS